MMPDVVWQAWRLWSSPMAWRERALLVVLALVIDAVVGDPSALPHPVVQIGRLIQALELRLRQPQHSPGRQRSRGFLVAILVPIVSGGGTALVVWLAKILHPMAGTLMAAWLASTTVAAKGLAQAGNQVLLPLEHGDLPLAQRKAGEIVGRDTTELNEQEIARAAVETVAENTVDACVAPLFFTLLGGAPGAMAYRAINTLDSMLGHKNATHLHFGWASARLDDLANWLPARLAALIMPLAAACVGRSATQSWRAILRDARKHPSPNSGIPEAAVAGALGIQLGGINFYKGIPEKRALLGEKLRPLERHHIAKAISIMIVTSVLSSALFLLAGLALGR